ncbi:MAG: glycosyltransferase family 2 protein [Candidatus Omnitrophota bacterium]
MPSLSVIVPTYNSSRTIEKCLKAIKQSGFLDYELIVVDCASQDVTASISKKYANKTIELHENTGRRRARKIGIDASSGSIIVNVDSDVLIKADTLAMIAAYFSRHRQIDALTGLLSKEHPNPGFFSQYKNLYMHYIFKKLPERVSFLYGSIYALRRSAIEAPGTDIKIADDTALGQKLALSGKQIAFLNDLEVIHLKKYDLAAFIKNDFQIPFEWARIFLTYKGWKQLGRQGTGYAHSPKGQIASVLLAPVISLLLVGSLFGYNLIPSAIALTLIWSLLNFRFLAFLTKERGLFFGVLSFFVTFLDNILMAIAILCGFVAYPIITFSK